MSIHIYSPVLFKGRNPFFSLTLYGKLNSLAGSQNLYGFLSLVEVESAVARIDDSDGLSRKDKKKAIDHIEKRLSALKKEFEEIYPKNSRFRQTGAKNADIRAEFIFIWAKIQKMCDSPCAPTGMALKYSPDKEKAAHKQLQIDQFLTPEAKFRPYDEKEINYGKSKEISTRPIY